jgi:translation initiation factor IF-2
MQPRQLRLGDILDDYCPRERRVTNHAVVAMIGDAVKQTRCTTCEADHEYKHAKVPRQRRKAETTAVLYSQVAATAPKRVVHESPAPAARADIHQGPEEAAEETREEAPEKTEPDEIAAAPASDPAEGRTDPSDEDSGDQFMHRRLIRATLPKHEGQQGVQRQATDFTIRQPAGRPGAARFRPRNQRGGGQPPFGSNGGRSSGGGGGSYGQSTRGGGMPRQNGGGRPQGPGHGPQGPGRHQGPRPNNGGKRSK